MHKQTMWARPLTYIEDRNFKRSFASPSAYTPGAPPGRQRCSPAPPPSDTQRPHGTWARDRARGRHTRTAGARLGRRLLLVVVLAAGALLGGRAVPAHAEYVEWYCGDSVHGVELRAYYHIVFPAGKEWTRFRYHLWLFPWNGDKNNVNIRLRSDGREIYEYKSPDDRTDDHWYNVVLTPSVVTSNFDQNSIYFEVIFDRGGWPDETYGCRFDLN